MGGQSCRVWSLSRHWGSDRLSNCSHIAIQPHPAGRSKWVQPLFHCSSFLSYLHSHHYPLLPPQCNPHAFLFIMIYTSPSYFTPTHKPKIGCKGGHTHLNTLLSHPIYWVFENRVPPSVRPCGKTRHHRKCEYKGKYNNERQWYAHDLFFSKTKPCFHPDVCTFYLRRSPYFHTILIPCS